MGKNTIWEKKFVTAIGAVISIGFGGYLVVWGKDVGFRYWFCEPGTDGARVGQKGRQNIRKRNTAKGRIA